MDFDLNDGQVLLQESVQKLLAARYGDLRKRDAYTKHPHGFDPAVWAEYAEQGLLGLPFSEALGGFAGGAVETMIVCEEFGRALAVEPFLYSVVLCGGILKGADPSMQERIIPAIIAGNKIIALAQQERGSRADLHDVSLTARSHGDFYVIEGEKSIVIGGGAADALIVVARTGGGRREPAGITLFLVDANSPGVSRRVYPMQDGMQAAEISFAQVSAGAERIIGAPGAGLALLQRGVDAAVAALCAEAVGAMDALVKLTVDYLKARKQFGVAIGSFQALQHRCADMLVMLEQARSMAIYAALTADAQDPAARRQAVAAAKVQIGRSATFIGQQATQLHGGIGMTMAYQGGHYFKRLTMIEQAFGDSDHHLRLLSAGGSLLGF